MELTFYCKNLNGKEEQVFVDYINEKIPVIEPLLKKFASDASLLKASIEKFDKHDAYQVEFCLVLPTKSLVATEASHQITKAVDLSKDRLTSQIKKHMALLRKSRVHKSIREHQRVTVPQMAEITEEMI